MPSPQGPARTLLHYRLEEKIGQGGMGVVWKALDTKLHRRVALKVLPSKVVADPEKLKRFAREARAAAAINHPYVASVFEINEEAGTTFIVMELVEGKTLRSRIGGKALEVGEALRLASEVAEGLSQAHGAGVVHRDLKPENIIVRQDGHPKILDFGLAKLLEEPREIRASEVSGLDTVSAEMTREGLILGTAAYMSPEQARGEKVDHRSDIFSFGTVLYEMLTGKMAFAGSTPMDTLTAIMRDRPPAASRLNAAVPPEVDAFLERCLEKSAERRFADMEELRAALDAARGSALTPEVSIRGLRARLPRRRALAAIASLVLVATAVAVWVGVRRRASTPEGPLFASIAVLPLENQSEDPNASAHIGMGISDQLTTKLTELGGFRVSPWMTTRRYTNLKRPLDKIAEELGVDALMVGTFQMASGRLRGSVSIVDVASMHNVWAEEFDEPVEDLFAVQRKIAIAAATRLKGKLTGEEEAGLSKDPSVSVDAFEFYYRGAEALQREDKASQDKALAYFDQARQLDPNMAKAYVGIGAVQTARYFNGWEGGRKSLEAAEESFNRALALDPDNMPARGGLIRVYWEEGQRKKCLVQGLLAARTGRRDPEALFVAAQAYVLAYIPAEAIPILNRVIELDPANRGAHWFKVLALAWSGRYDEAIDEGDIFYRRFGDDPEINLWVSVSYALLGDLDPAQVQMELAMEEFSPGSRPERYIYAGALYRLLNDKERSHKVVSEGVEIVRNKLAAYGDNLRMRGILAKLYALLGDSSAFHAEERPLLERAAENPYVFMDLSQAYGFLGEDEVSMDLADRALRLGTGPVLMDALIEASPRLQRSEAFRSFLASTDELNRRLASEYPIAQEILKTGGPAGR